MTACWTMRVIRLFKWVLLVGSFSWFLIIISEFVLHFSHTPAPTRPPGHRKFVVVNSSAKYSPSPHIILFWTKYFERHVEDYSNSSISLKDLRCPYSNCVVTSDRSYASFSEAFIFHWRDFDRHDLPDVRRSDQIWLLHNLEAPTHTNLNQFPEHLVFNFTSSYRLDSGFYNPYGKIVARRKQLKIQKKFNKTKLVAWFVSNCKTPGNRESYVTELNKHIPVDVYGGCGPFKCDIKNKNSCFKMLERDYKFYLSFENSICKDYVTEKLFGILSYYILPVVFGGADYQKLLPAHSYINALDYTPKELAYLLIRLSQNETEYNKYFSWKQKYNVEQAKEFGFLCELCQRLNVKNVTQVQSIDYIFDWWFKKGECRSWKTSNIWFKRTLVNKSTKI